MLQPASRTIPIVLTLTFALLQPAVSRASAIKDQAFEPSPDTIPTIFREYRWAQTFTVGVTGTLTGVEVLVAQLFAVQPQDLEVTIFDTVNGVPHAPLTASFHLSPSTIPLVPHVVNFDSYAWLHAVFALPVTGGDVLAIVLSTGDMSQYYWAGKFSGGYPGGRLYETTGGSWHSDYPTEDQAFRTFVALSRAPTANAGIDQTVRPGTTVNLDGSGSYDDNTETPVLQYAWSLVSVPDGSAVTALDGAKSITASFTPDLSGNYVVQLIVTDQDGLSSSPSLVTIGENLPPTADAGPDQLTWVGMSVFLNGSASDPNGDSVTSSWRVTVAPSGSNPQFGSPTLAGTTFVADRPGVYVATLTPSDFIGPGISATTTITVATTTGYAAINTYEAAARVRDLPAEAVTSAGNRNALLQLLSNAVVALEGNNLAGARQLLEEAMWRTDGCWVLGRPDGNGPRRDWITDCLAQWPVYRLLLDALAAIES